MDKITLFHGSPNKNVVPEFGLGDERHDYGKGFYLTPNKALAKEWAVYRPNEQNGWLHKYVLDTKDLKIFDFKNESILCWLAELMKHRDASDTRRYKMLAQKFIGKYAADTSNYDVIKGWRANASYFYIAKEFVRDNVDVDILEELLSLGDLGTQYCIKSKLAFSKLRNSQKAPLPVNYTEFNRKYNLRDTAVRNKMRDLINSDANAITRVFSTLV